jgi:hypothetical protein
VVMNPRGDSRRVPRAILLSPGPGFPAGNTGESARIPDRDSESDSLFGRPGEPDAGPYSGYHDSPSGPGQLGPGPPAPSACQCQWMERRNLGLRRSNKQPTGYLYYWLLPT